MKEENKKYIKRKIEKVDTNKQSVLKFFLNSILKINIAIALFIIISFSVNAGDVVVESGKITTTGELKFNDFLGTHINLGWGNGYGIGVDGSTTVIYANPGFGGVNIDFRDGPTGNTRMRIKTDSGNVGIGTTGPEAKLTVETQGNANVRFENTLSTAARGSWMWLFEDDGTTADDAGIGLRVLSRRPSTGTGRQVQIGNVNTGEDDLVILDNGNVGIGTSGPNNKLEVVGSVLLGNADTLLSGDIVGLSGQTRVQAGPFIVDNGNGGINLQIAVSSSGYETINSGNPAHPIGIQTTGGNVGIGTPSPASPAKLDVAGEIHSSDTSSGFYLGGGSWVDNWARLTTDAASTYHDLAIDNLWAAGALRYDLAEVTPVKAEDKLEQGDAVVIDKEDGLRVTRSTKPYDTSVYGIVSSYDQASMIIGGIGGPEVAMNTSKHLPIALIGRVKAKVSAENGAIQVGDLLTTSSTPGHLMKCDDISKCAGAIAGKALESLTNRKGTIVVLVTLQ